MPAENRPDGPSVIHLTRSVPLRPKSGEGAQAGRYQFPHMNALAAADDGTPDPVRNDAVVGGCR